jgi:bifunctional non-homologous end joining protein LigD
MAAKPGGRLRKQSATIGGTRITHPDRVLYPDAQITKRDLAEYFAAVADWILPGIAGRPLSLVRCPAGIARECFFQKHAGLGLAPAIREVRIAETGGKSVYLALSSRAGLLALAQMNVLELHPWGARAADIEHPDRVIFDFDPGPDTPWSAVLEAARDCRERLSALGLASFVRTTGGKGLHVVAPIARRHGWDEVRAFARSLAQDMAGAAPDRYTAKAAKAARRGRVFIDYMRNGRGATAIASYSPRARAGATVATPLAWSELSPELDPKRFTIKTVPGRLARLGKDPWRGIAGLRQSLPRPAPKPRVRTPKRAR